MRKASPFLATKPTASRVWRVLFRTSNRLEIIAPQLLIELAMPATPKYLIEFVDRGSVELLVADDSEAAEEGDVRACSDCGGLWARVAGEWQHEAPNCRQFDMRRFRFSKHVANTFFAGCTSLETNDLERYVARRVNLGVAPIVASLLEQLVLCRVTYGREIDDDRINIFGVDVDIWRNLFVDSWKCNPGVRGLYFGTCMFVGKEIILSCTMRISLPNTPESDDLLARMKQVSDLRVFVLGQSEVDPISCSQSIHVHDLCFLFVDFDGIWTESGLD